MPADVVAEALERGGPTQTATPFSSPPPVTAGPTRAHAGAVGRDDRFFPAAFQRRVAEERLGITPDEMPGGHLMALSRASELADRLVRVLGRDARRGLTEP